jgi:hypothetical protein
LLRDYTPEVESFRDDAVAIVNASAVVVALMGLWTQPILMEPLALVIAAVGYVLSPRSRGGTVGAVFIIALISLATTWWLNKTYW